MRDQQNDYLVEYPKNSENPEYRPLHFPVFSLYIIKHNVTIKKNICYILLGEQSVNIMFPDLICIYMNYSAPGGKDSFC